MDAYAIYAHKLVETCTCDHARALRNIYVHHAIYKCMLHGHMHAQHMHTRTHIYSGIKFCHLYIWPVFKMETGVRQVLQTNQEEAAICIQLDYLLPELRRRKLVTDLEFRQLSDDKRMSDDKNKALLRLIETKGGEKSFDLFVQALEAERQHTGHEHLAKVLREAKAALKSRVITPPKPPPKPYKKVLTDAY